MQPIGNIIDLPRRTETNMAAAREVAVIEFDRWKYKRYFEFIWSESKNMEAGLNVMSRKWDDHIWNCKISTWKTATASN